jgi:hypothetical protein
MSNSTAQTSAAQAAAHNLEARQLLLHTGTPMRKKLGVFGPFQPGDEASVLLNNVGIITSLDCVVTGTAAIPTTAGTLTPMGLYNLVKQVRVQDYDNQNRVKCSHRALHVINSMRSRQPHNQAKIFDSSFGNESTFANLIVAPTALTDTQLRLPVHIPIAYDPANDLRGAILAQTIRGQMSVALTFATAAQITGTTADNVYSAGTVTLSDFYVTVYQNYIQPQALGAQLPIPQQDLVTVYELNGNGGSSSNLAAGQAKYIDYPNVRQILSSVHAYYDGTSFAYGTNIDSLILQANANTNLREYDGRDILDQMRAYMGTDTLPGTYYIDTRRVPVDTTLYGNVQLLMTPNATPGTGAYVESTFESFYLKGTTLPGIQVG